GRARCTACGLCARACPSGCIVLDGVKRDGEKKKSVSKYELDFSKCSLCGSCVEICASDAIEFSKKYNVVGFSREEFSHIDVHARIAAMEKSWAKAHPQTVVAEPAAAPAAPAVAAMATATAVATPEAKAP